jgi:hypothetical protein
MRTEGYLQPRVLQAVGVLLLLGSAVFWGVTGHQSALLIGAALSLIGLGAYSGLHISIKQELMREADERDRSNGA